MKDKAYPLKPLFGRILSPFEQFLRRTTAGGIVLIATTVVALALAIVFGAEAMHLFTEQPLGFSAGGRPRLELSLHHWINDGLMSLFFLLVGLELKREILVCDAGASFDAGQFRRPASEQAYAPMPTRAAAKWSTSQPPAMRAAPTAPVE
jgi:NhaA family Na+:H+ antiporter